MQIFLTGANGFIGGAIASRLVADGHRVRGLVRDQAKAEAVAAHGVVPVIGALGDAGLLRAEAAAAEAVVNAASSDNRGAVEALLAGLEGSQKPFLHTSGSSLVGDEAMGEPSDRIFHEDTPIVPEPDKVARVAIDTLIRGAGGVVLCNTMIYGHAMGEPAESVQVPRLARQARASGIARYIGRGLNRWSNVHIADVADLYALALEKAPRGSFMYVESGEEELGNVARAIATRLGLGEAQPWSAEEAIATWGREMAVFGLGSNSRVRGRLAGELGWKPRRRSITEWIREEL
ncbi:NAD-dependent epimerase/dehydratase family protein [Roseococcus pinisoli]|uniref:NAD-dependent epimerase/dehydratase family protein n=1 Tax=Roseococcus pinisoli TaxID=2835040 RepID=A0ABS5QBS6_9PROT|nr:NAD-dependent epimerase/dehydratase family protein [Roseococcus pinisoli]MBS7811140.1 NAD-dependent epimerase/dehydratase family protein [Roseococcus pinisoli]